MNEPTSPEKTTQPLTLDMIKPTPDNLIPPNGIYPKTDLKLGNLWKNFTQEPNNFAARQEFLDYISKLGCISPISKYLAYLNLHPEISDNMSLEAQLEETEMLRDAFMNAAESARRRNEYWKSSGFPPSEEKEMFEYLRYSLQYQEAAEKLRQKIEAKNHQPPTP